MALKDLMLGAHLFFAREGDVIDTVTVGAESKPDADPEANWTKLGSIEQFEPRNERTFIERRSPSPGAYRTRVKIPTQQKLFLNFSVQEWDEMTLAEMLLNAEKPVAGVFVPNSRVLSVRGWFKVQAYNYDNQLTIAMDVWGDASIDSYQFGEKMDPYALQIEVLYSSLNTGEITNL